jgi:hypothetical protein
MYQFSRAIYREVACDIDVSAHGPGGSPHLEVVRICDAAMERLATDHHYFARPARTLFGDLKPYFPLRSQPRVWAIVSRYVAAAEAMVQQGPLNGTDLLGNPLMCRATTRRGTPCQRMPHADNGYCPSHQHLVETDRTQAEAERTAFEAERTRFVAVAA